MSVNMGDNTVHRDWQHLRNFRESMASPHAPVEPGIELPQPQTFSKHNSSGHQESRAPGLTLGSFHSNRSTTAVDNLKGSAASSPYERKGVVDGTGLEFDLQQNVTQKPATDRLERLEFSTRNINVSKSTMEVRLRLWLMQFCIKSIAVMYFAAYIILNVAFAGLWFIQEGKCCDDPSHTFGQIFDFSIQTSTTVGYGGYVPIGPFSNFLVVMLSISTLVLNTLFAGLLFLKFVTPSAKVEFSDIMTLCNVSGLPCLEIRVGNADGGSNKLLDVTARLAYNFIIEYKDDKGNDCTFSNTEILQLVSENRHQLVEVWTIRHVIDESSPLFGLRFDEFPGKAIRNFRVSVTATQDITKTPIIHQTAYMIEDVLIGHRFQDQVSWCPKTKIATFDYSKMNETNPCPVWYPCAQNEL